MTVPESFVMEATPRTADDAAPTRRREPISEVAAGVAHELRNPLVGISSAAQLLRFRAREDPVVERNVGRILREVEHLNRLMSTLHELGRPHPLRLAHADPDAIWDDVVADQQGHLESAALTLRRTRPDHPVRIDLDAEQITQAFQQVLMNAIEAAPHGSELTLTSSVRDAGGWQCRLHNGGEAITADVMPRVFDLFFSTRPGGIGVGLPIARRIVEDHRGTIALDSTADAGTICTIVLPASRQ